MKLKVRWAVILVLVGWSLFAMFPLDQKVKLGLDLQGGMHVVLGVDTDKAVEARVESLAGQLRKEFRAQNIPFLYVQKLGLDRVKLALPNPVAFEKARTILDENYGVLSRAGLTDEENVIVAGLDSREVSRLRDYAVQQSLEVVRNRIDQFGVSEPVIQRQGANQVLVQLPGITDPDRAIGLIGQTAQLKFHIVDDSVDPSAAESGNLPFDSMVLYERVADPATGQTVSTIPYVVKREALMTGEYIVDAGMSFSADFNQPYVWVRFDSAGAKLFEEVTAANVGRNMAIVLDGNVYSAPNIRERIPGGEARITGSFTEVEAKDLAIVLRAGSLPAPVDILENRTVGPSLGRDSIRAGIMAAGIGLVLIIAFMAVYYRLAGFLADIALVTNLVLITGVLSQFGATLTLPGIAGIILTIGMSVDANVLIFERIREEVRAGRTPMNAMELGYEKAFVTIMDANITTIIAAIVLFQFGTGPIKGFAVTLSIGIIASLFTAIFVTRTIFATIYRGRDMKKLSI